MTPIPLLILSDSPSSRSGLGRITRDLAARLHTHCSDVFRVGTCGVAGTGSRSLPFQQYETYQTEWLLPDLPKIWADFAGDEKGIIFTIWDASRLAWFTYPEICPDTNLRAWLERARQVDAFRKWMYLPLDACGVGGKLPFGFREVIENYDRVICYSAWAESIVRATLDAKDCDRLQLCSLPHGIDTSVFYPRDKKESRDKIRKGNIRISDDTFLVGMVATNQPRKDFALGFETCSLLQQSGLDVRIWIHTDKLRRYWDINALAHDFGLQGKGIITTELPDDSMAVMYSACDVTLGIGNGEGFGFPIFESLACGVPCVHGEYGGADEWLPSDFKVASVYRRFEGQFNCKRPVYCAYHWVSKVQRAKPQSDGSPLLDFDLDWNNLWPRWEAWFRKGVQ